MDMHLFFLRSFISYFINSVDKYLKSLSCRFSAKVSREEFKNCTESKKIIFLLTIILLYSSIDLGITSLLLSLYLCNSLKSKWPSYPCKLWKKIGNFGDIFNLELHCLCAGPKFSCYVTMTSYFIFITYYLFITYPTVLCIFIMFFIFSRHY